MKSNSSLKKFAKRVLVADDTITNSQLFNICRSEFAEVEESTFVVTLHRAIWYVKHHYNQQRNYKF